jgi:hypothetical protein
MAAAMAAARIEAVAAGPHPGDVFPDLGVGGRRRPGSPTAGRLLTPLRPLPLPFAPMTPYHVHVPYEHLQAPVAGAYAGELGQAPTALTRTAGVAAPSTVLSSAGACGKTGLRGAGSGAGNRTLLVQRRLPPLPWASAANLDAGPTAAAPATFTEYASEGVRTKEQGTCGGALQPAAWEWQAGLGLDEVAEAETYAKTEEQRRAAQSAAEEEEPHEVAAAMEPKEPEAEPAEAETEVEPAETEAEAEPAEAEAELAEVDAEASPVGSLEGSPPPPPWSPGTASRKRMRPPGVPMGPSLVLAIPATSAGASAAGANPGPGTGPGQVCSSNDSMCCAAGNALGAAHHVHLLHGHYLSWGTLLQSLAHNDLVLGLYVPLTALQTAAKDVCNVCALANEGEGCAIQPAPARP